MLFSALASAYVVRRGLSDDWVPLQLPSLFNVSGILLVLSSVLLEAGRRRYEPGKRDPFRIFWFGGAAVGVLFAVTQVYWWSTVAPANMSVTSSPAMGFFLVLTGSFVLFLAGAVMRLVWVGIDAVRGDQVPRASERIKTAAYYWHYLDGLWLCLLMLFYLGNR
jgi:cytochrome c oxidase subunit 3